MAEENAKAQAASGNPRKKKRAVLIGALTAVLLVALGAWLLRTALTPKPAAAPDAASSIGMMDLETVLKAHPSYDKLQELEKEKQAILLELEDLEDPGDGQEREMQARQLDSKPFDDSVWQKNAQAVIGGRSQLERERKSLRKSYEEKHEAEYEARKNALDGEYRNAILNLQIKLDNRDAMRLSAADVSSLEDQLTSLKQERGYRQWQLYQSWQREIDSYVSAIMDPKIEAWKAQAKTVHDQQASAALAKQSEAQARDTQNMQAQAEQMDAAQKAQLRLGKQKALQDKQDELDALESHILNDIAGRAAKLAILHHFTLVFATPARTIPSLLYEKMPFGVQPEQYQDVISVDGTDITDEIVEEMQSL